MTKFEIKNQMAKAQNALNTAYSELSEIWDNTEFGTEEHEKASKLMDEIAEMVLTHF